MSGVVREVGEMDEFLSCMKKARQDFLTSNTASRKAAQEREAENERIGVAVFLKAMS